MILSVNNLPSESPREQIMRAKKVNAIRIQYFPFSLYTCINCLKSIHHLEIRMRKYKLFSCKSRFQWKKRKITSTVSAAEVFLDS